MEEDEEFVYKIDGEPKIMANMGDERRKFKKERQSVLMNLCVFALLTAFFSLIFMYTLAKKSKEEEYVGAVLPFHNPQNRTQLMCPTNTSFDTNTFTCKQCSENCRSCYHEFSVKCIKCVPPYKLYKNDCIDHCISQQGVCLSEEPVNYKLFDLGSEQKIQSHLMYSVYNSSEQNMMIILPPLGETHTYLQGLKYTSLGKELNATIVIFSMPYTDALQLQETDPNDSQQEEYRFVERIGQALKEGLKLAKTIRIVVMGDSLFFGHELSHMMYINLFQDYIKQDLCYDCRVIVTILQTKELGISKILKIDYVDLSNLLSYIYEYKDIKHQENGTISHEDQVTDISQLINDVRKEFDFENLFKAAFNMEIEIEGFVELGSDEFQEWYIDFRAKSLREMRILLGEDEESKLVNLFMEIVRAQ